MRSADDVQAFHAGERLMQERVGVRDRMAAHGKQIIHNAMSMQHQTFFAQLPFVIVGSVDAEGQPWASILHNPPGFMHNPDAHHLLMRVKPSLTDPLHETLTLGAKLALLGIEQHTRRRNRMNGFVERITDEGYLIAVRQSFGNCPKYIQARRAEYWDEPITSAAQNAKALNASTRQIILRADTLFIASAHPESNQGTVPSHGADISHRGGKPGFVRVDGHDTLTIPDFAGNRFFNTLGNIALNPRAGLLFIDFESRDLLYVAADAKIIFDGPVLASFAGAERLLQFNMRHVRHVPAALPLRWRDEVQESPFLANTGSW